MIRHLFIAAIATAAIAFPAEAKRVARPLTPVEKVARAEVVVVGTVSAIEKETVDAARFPGDTEKTPHRIAVIKIEKGLVGAAAITHIKVGFIPPPPVDPTAPRPPIRGGRQPVDLKVGQEGVFFLIKHPGGEFYTISPMMTPLDSKEKGFKAQVLLVEKAAAALADPMKALKAEKAEDRLLAATVLLGKYRSYPENGGPTQLIKVPADESRLILKSIADADWKAAERERPERTSVVLPVGSDSPFRFPAAAAKARRGLPGHIEGCVQNLAGRSGEGFPDRAGRAEEMTSSHDFSPPRPHRRAPLDAPVGPVTITSVELKRFFARPIR